MKQGLNFELPVIFEVDLSEVSQIDFLFVQGTVSKTFTYPSTTAVRVGNNTVKLTWTADDTWKFRTKEPIYMDSKITMSGTTNNPETEIVSFTMHSTLFEQDEEE